MKKQNYNSNTPEELTKVVADKREALRVLRFSASGSKNQNVKEAKNVRKEIARALTALHASTGNKK
jgi:ribosomal protein L29